MTGPPAAIGTSPDKRTGALVRMKQNHSYHVRFELHILLWILILGHTVSLANEQGEGDFCLQETQPLTATHPSVALLGGLLRLEKRTCQLLSRMGLLSHPEPSRKKQGTAASTLLFMAPHSTLWESRPFPRGPKG